MLVETLDASALLNARGEGASSKSERTPPPGFGGWLFINGKINRHVADAVTNEDAKLSDVDIGSHVVQQIWEASAVLLALELFVAECTQRRMSLQVRGDNVGALVLLI